MRKKVIIFFAVVLLFMAILPAINLWRAPNELIQQIAAKPKSLQSTLYNTDILKRATNALLFPYGISTEPMRTIIGYDNWLFLGDEFSQNFSRKRSISKQDKLNIDTLVSNSEDWYQWLKEKNIHYQVLIAPDKESVYTDVLPLWAKSPKLPIEQLQEQANPDIIKTVLHALVEEKAHHTVFYKYDTHWNIYGGVIGLYDFLAQPNNPFADLKWPVFDKSKSIEHPNFSSFDLGAFLYLPMMPQTEQMIVEVADPADNVLLYDGPPSTHTPTTLRNHLIPNMPYPQWVINNNALNDKKLIWLRDSFGSPVTTYINSAFKEVIQVNHTHLSRDDFIHLIETEKPDYVLISSVEREMFNGALMFPAPNKK